MKARRPITRLVYIAMMLAFTVGWAQADPLALPAPTGTWNVTVDGGTPFTVTYYQNVVYVANPVPVKVVTVNPDKSITISTTYNYQSMNLYVPSTATKDSPIILQDNNGGWNGTPPTLSVGVAGTPPTGPGTVFSTSSSFNSDGTTKNTSQKVAVALKAGYIIANVGCRFRGSVDMNGNYIGHAPAQIVDVKAAIRYLRYNKANITGNTDRVIITGSSGGGALGVAVAATGNSPDYYPYLYAIGAAGVNCSNGTCSSTIKDDLFGTALYCPITDLNHMDAAYEWLYGQTRRELPTYIVTVPNPTPPPANINQTLTYSTAQYDASDFYAADYVTYFNGLGLRDENGKGLTASNFLDAIQAAAQRGIEKAYREVGPVQMALDITNSVYADSSWYSIDANGKATVNMDKYLQFVVKNKPLKGIPASDNLASPFPNPEPTHNESSEAGTTAQAYSNFDDWAWNNNAIKGDNVGYDDTGLLWQDFIQTPAGKAVVKQMDMISPMPYLTGGTGDASPYWYFRAGMKDRDTSFDVPVALHYAVLNSSDVSDVNFNLAWLKPHSGDYDVPEAYEWVAEALDNAKYFDAIGAAIPSGQVTSNFPLPTGDAFNVITYSSSNQSVFHVVNGQAVVTQPALMDAKLTLKVEVVSDKPAGDGYNNPHGYGKVDVTRAFTFTVPALSKDQCKDGGWQHLFSTDGNAFKNQGACIQYVNTGK